MRSTRQIVALIACFIAAPILIYRSFVGLPAESDLTKVKGTVTEVLMVERMYKFMTTEHPAISISGYSEPFLYLDWFPEPEAFMQEIRSGDHVVLLSDMGKNNWIWKIQKEGNIIVAYADIRKAVASNNRLDPWLGGILLIIGCLGAYKLTKKGMSSNSDT